MDDKDKKLGRELFDTFVTGVNNLTVVCQGLAERVERNNQVQVEILRELQSNREHMASLQRQVGVLVSVMQGAPVPTNQIPHPPQVDYQPMIQDLATGLAQRFLGPRR